MLTWAMQTGAPDSWTGLARNPRDYLTPNRQVCRSGFHTILVETAVKVGTNGRLDQASFDPKPERAAVPLKSGEVTSQSTAMRSESPAV